MTVSPSHEAKAVTRALESAIWVEAHLQAAQGSILKAIGASRRDSDLRRDIGYAMAKLDSALGRTRKTIERERRRK